MTSHTCVTQVKNIGAIMEDSLKSVFHEIRKEKSLCAVFNCGNHASRETEKSYFCFLGIVSNNAEGLVLSKARRDKWLACNSREDLTKDKLRYTRICSDHFVSGKYTKTAV